MTGLHDDPVLTALQDAWPGWKIWRGNRAHCVDCPPILTGDWYASRMDDSVGVHPTAVGSTPADLDRALRDEAVAAARGMQPLTPSPLGQW